MITASCRILLNCDTYTLNSVNLSSCQIPVWSGRIECQTSRNLHNTTTCLPFIRCSFYTNMYIFILYVYKPVPKTLTFFQIRHQGWSWNINGGLPGLHTCTFSSYIVFFYMANKNSGGYPFSFLRRHLTFCDIVFKFKLFISKLPWPPQVLSFISYKFIINKYFF